jgi:hypothetical protein
MTNLAAIIYLEAKFNIACDFAPHLVTMRREWLVFMLAMRRT